MRIYHLAGGKVSLMETDESGEHGTLSEKLARFLLKNNPKEWFDEQTVQAKVLMGEFTVSEEASGTQHLTENRKVKPATPQQLAQKMEVVEKNEEIEALKKANREMLEMMAELKAQLQANKQPEEKPARKTKAKKA